MPFFWGVFNSNLNPPIVDSIDHIFRQPCFKMFRVSHGRILLLGLSLSLPCSAPAKKPNFVYVLCDDMNELLGDETIVKQTRSLLADQGARMANAFASLAHAYHSTYRRLLRLP